MANKEVIMHLVYPPPLPQEKKLHNHCLCFLGTTAVPRTNWKQRLCKILGVNKVQYGSCENGEYQFSCTKESSCNNHRTYLRLSSGVPPQPTMAYFIYFLIFLLLVLILSPLENIPFGSQDLTYGTIYPL